MNDAKPRIAIVIPVYNAESFIGKCIESIQRQSYRNLEIVIANDGSTDNTEAIINKYAEEDNRIKYYRLEHSGWPKIARDSAYSKVAADWVIPVDADDYISDDYIETLWSRLEETEADIVCSRMTFLDDNNKEYGSLPAESFDWGAIIDGPTAASRTIDGWQFSMNGALLNKQLLSHVDMSVPAKYTDEVDSRYMLYYAKTVAFANVKYLYNYNPNSVVRNSSRKIRYFLRSQLGLVEFVCSHYSNSSDIIRRQYNQSFMSLIGTFKDIRSLDKEDQYLQEDKSLWLELRNKLKGKFSMIGNRPFYQRLLIAIYVSFATMYLKTQVKS